MIWHYRENRVLRTRCEGETTVSLIIINNGVRYYAGSFMKNDLSQWQTQEKEINPSYAGILSFLYFKEASKGTHAIICLFHFTSLFQGEMGG